MTPVKCVIIRLELARDTEVAAIMKRSLRTGNALTLARSVEALVPVYSLTELRTLRALYGDPSDTESVGGTELNSSAVGTE